MTIKLGFVSQPNLHITRLYDKSISLRDKASMSDIVWQATRFSWMKSEAPGMARLEPENNINILARLAKCK